MTTPKQSDPKSASVPAPAAKPTAPVAAGPAPAPPAAPAPAPPTAAPAPVAPPAPTDIVAGPGGVMTDEVGVVTGDLTVQTVPHKGGATVRVQYKDAEEWYTVTGSKVTLRDPADAAAVHALAVGLLHRPEG